MQRVDDGLLVKYYQRLKNDLYKALTIHEGRDSKTKQVVFTREDAYDMYSKYMQNLCIQVSGVNGICLDNVDSLTLLGIMLEMRGITIDEHSLLRTLVFKCINLREVIIKSIDVNGGDSDGL
jgi:hypothetical protein